jgi:photosystem II stability/assembly factor-like uncharacterized protein
MLSPAQKNWISVASSSDGTKLIAAAPDYICTSSDSGATWTQTQTGSPSQQHWTSVASSSDGTKLVAVTDEEFRTGGAIYTSSDSGATWRQRW